MIKCPWCYTCFTPKRKGHLYCNAKCQGRDARDKEYFGGHKRSSVGYDEQICWVCGRTKVKRMPTHHVMGRKEADEPLVELCPGCHELVELLAKRRLLSDEKMVAALITLARFKAGLPDARTIIRYEYT